MDKSYLPTWLQAAGYSTYYTGCAAAAAIVCVLCDSLSVVTCWLHQLLDRALHQQHHHHGRWCSHMLPDPTLITIVTLSHHLDLFSLLPA